MTPRLRLYEFLATPAHAYLWLIAELCGVDFSYRIADATEPTLSLAELAELNAMIRSNIEHFIASENAADLTCPRCGKRYRDHEIGGGDPCVS